MRRIVWTDDAGRRTGKGSARNGVPDVLAVNLDLAEGDGGAINLHEAKIRYLEVKRKGVGQGHENVDLLIRDQDRLVYQPAPALAVPRQAALW